MQNKQSITLENHPKYGHCVYVNNHAATARISLFGAHLLSYISKADQRDRLWLSDKAMFDGKTPIRGGVPICWPWFGPHNHKSDFPSHGFARTQNWKLASADEQINREGNVSETQLTFLPDTLGLFDTAKELKVALLITIGEQCEVQIDTQNNSKQPQALSQAIHTYFRVNDIDIVSIRGIEQPYYNKIDNSYNNLCPKHYALISETDRVHMLDDTRSDQQITVLEHDKEMTHIYQSGHNSTVVWNPWEDKSKSMKDMSDEGFKTMLCIEAATEPEIMLAPGQQHVLTQRFY